MADAEPAAKKGITFGGTVKFALKTTAYAGATMMLGGIFAAAHAGPAAQALSTAYGQGSALGVIKGSYGGWGEAFGFAKDAVIG